MLREWLFVFPKVKRSLLFERAGDEFKFGKKLGGENRAIQSLTRPNSLFLSAAAQNNHRMLTPVYQWFAMNVDFVRGDRRPFIRKTAQALNDVNNKLLARLSVELLKRADLGVENVAFEERQAPKGFEESLQSLPLEVRAQLVEASKVLNVFMHHRTTNDRPTRLALDEESQGTIALFALIGPLFQSLLSGRVLCVDDSMPVCTRYWQRY